MLAVNNTDTPLFHNRLAKILLIEDNEGDAGLVRAILNPNHFDIEWCSSANAARTALHHDQFDAVLLDHGLPDTNALTFLSEIKSEHFTMPVIVLTGHEDEALALSSLKNGAQNYILKDEIFDHLQPALDEAIQPDPPVSAPQPQFAAENRFVDRANQLYKTLLETMHDGCCVISPDGLLVFANEAFASFTGLAVNELLGQPASYLFPETAAFSFNTYFERVKHGEISEGKTIESSLQDSNGVSIPVQLSFRSLRTENGTFDGLMLIVTDVAELVWARKKLDTLYRYEHQQNRKLQALSDIAAAVTDLSPTNILATSCKIISDAFGFDVVVFGEVDTQSITISPNHYLFRKGRRANPKRPITINRWQKCALTAAVEQKKMVHIGDIASSNYAPHKMTPANSYTECALPIIVNQKPIAVLDVINQKVNSLSKDDLLLLQVIGERIAKAFENAHLFDSVQQERQRLAALIESSQEGVLFFSKQLKISVINSQVITWLDLPGKVSDWLNRPVQHLIKALRHKAPELTKTFLQEIRRALMGEMIPSYGEFNATPYALSWYSTPVSMQSSSGWMFVLRDISKEQAIEQMRQDLTHTMVHDLRNPLAIVLGMLDLLQHASRYGEADLRGRQKECVEYASSSAKKLMRLVNNILEVGKLESDQMPIEQTAVYLPNLIDQCVAEQAALLESKKLKLEVTVPDNLPQAWVDPDLIERVLQNLIDNAIKFTPEDGEISMFAFQIQSASDPMLAISVADTGRGIPPEAQKHLFEKFFTLNRTGKGSGLGLAFCRLVIEQHGGKIWVNSIPEKGSRFIFTLPLAKSY